MTSIAIIKTGGKQYKVLEGTVVKVEKINRKEGDKIKFPVLFIGDEKEVVIGKPEIEGALVEGKVVKQTRGKKVVGVKHKPKKRQLKKFGHRQDLTEIEIIKIKK